MILNTKRHIIISIGKKLNLQTLQTLITSLNIVLAWLIRTVIGNVAKV